MCNIPLFMNKNLFFITHCLLGLPQNLAFQFWAIQSLLFHDSCIECSPFLYFFNLHEVFYQTTIFSAASTVSNVLVSRLGLFGAISVNWRLGYPAGGFTIGTINPSQGTVSFVQGERSKAFSFSVRF